MKVRYVGPYAEGVDIPAVVDGYHQLLRVRRKPTSKQDEALLIELARLAGWPEERQAWVEGDDTIDVSDELAEGLLSQGDNWEPIDPAGRKVAKAAQAALEERRERRVPVATVAEIEQAHAAKTPGGSPKHHEERPIAITEPEVTQ